MIDAAMWGKIISAVIKVESGGNAGAVSPAGAKGLMQLMDATGKEVLRDLGFEEEEYNPFNEKQNILLGSTYLKKLYGMFGDLRLAFAAYNAGMGRVSRLCMAHGDYYNDIRDHLPAETKNYVEKIQSELHQMGVFL
ncbi:MAG: lytic transglycosylase domain-containing protein [Alphaproteobacteria bacterium]|nr:lytic transglycosylase domain-containing protein [Alphaproteobacteria bacterium]